MGRAIRVGLARRRCGGVWDLSGGTFAQVAPRRRRPAHGCRRRRPTTRRIPTTRLKAGRSCPRAATWGSTSAVEIDKDGRSIWVAERCAGQHAAGTRPGGKMSPLNTVFKFDPDRQAGHELRPGHVRVPARHPRRSRRQHLGDRRQRQPARARARLSRPMRRCRAMPAKVVGHQVIKFSPEGKVLLTLGKPGGNRPGQTPRIRRRSISRTMSSPIRTATSSSPKATAGAATARLIRFDKTGKFIKRVRQDGHRPRGRVHAAARPGVRFDAAACSWPIARTTASRSSIRRPSRRSTRWYQFSRLSGIFIKDDIIYGADSESGSVSPPHYAWKRGIRIGSARDGKVTAFIPDPSHDGLTYDDGRRQGRAEDGRRHATAPAARSPLKAWRSTRTGNIYGAEVGPRKLQRYVKK